MTIDLYETLADLRAAHYPLTSPTACYVLGHSSDTDGGGGHFAWDANSLANDNDGTVVKPSTLYETDPGRWLRMLDDAAAISVRWFGAAGDGTTDDTNAIQAAITAATTVTPSPPVYFPTGNYLCSDTLVIADLVSHNFVNLTLYAHGKGCGDGRYGALIHSTVTDRPAIAIQAGRGVKIKGLTIQGDNNPSPNPPTNNEPDVSKYIGAGFKSDRYGPQCAICIDPWSGAGPPSGQGYPDPNSLYYGNWTGSGSAMTTIEDIAINGFVAGIVVAPYYDENGSSYNGDTVNLRHCYITQCAYGFCIGGTQNRSIHIDGGNMTYCWAGIDGVTFGSQNGSNPSVQATQMAKIFRAYNTSGRAAGQPLYVSGVHIESVSEIVNNGKAVGGFGWAPAVFTGCMLNATSDVNDYASSTHCISFGNIQFVSCEFQIPDRYKGVLNVVGGGGARARFDNCRISFLASDTPILVGRTDMVYTPTNVSDGSAMYTATEQSDQQTYNIESELTTWPARVKISQFSRRIYYRGVEYRVIQPPELGGKHTLTMQASAVSIDPATAVVTFTQPVTGDYHYDSSLQVGDILRWRTVTKNGFYHYFLPMLEISDITGTTVTASPIFNKAEYDTAYSPGSYMYVYVPFYVPLVTGTATAPTGTLTNGSNQITAVDDTTGFAEGDAINAYSGGSQLLGTFARITAIDAGAGRITMNRTYTGATTAGVTLSFGQLSPA